MPGTEHIHKLLTRLEKQRATQLANMLEHKRLVEFSKQNLSITMKIYLGKWKIQLIKN